MRKIISLLLLIPIILSANPAIQTIPFLQRLQMEKYSWHTGCPVPLKQLRIVNVPYYGFDYQIHYGQLIVNQQVAQSVLTIFTKLADMRFPIKSIKSIDAFQGQDELSMQADNTSAFNCRIIKGEQRFSWHAYGLAIDINPVENPSVDFIQNIVDPNNGVNFTNRKDLKKGMLTPKVISLFQQAGWRWGGNWQTTKDYQHFEY